MKKLNKSFLLPLLLTLISIGVSHAEETRAATAGIPPAPTRERLLMDFDWRFSLGNAQDINSDFGFGNTKGSAWAYLEKQNSQRVTRLDFNDSAWKSIDVPRDWGMELGFDLIDVSSSWGFRPLGRSFPTTSIGWFRKKFNLPASDAGRRLVMEFEGVTGECMVFVNGLLVGSHHDSYTSFQFDVTDAIHFGGANAVTVRVNASEHAGWWYEGAGIYRHVWLTKTAPVHVAPWGTQVITENKAEAALVKARTQVKNESDQPVLVEVNVSVLDPKGKVVGSAASKPKTIEPGEQQDFDLVATVAAPELWSCETPNLYRLVTTLKTGAVVVDTTETPFGIRTIAFDPDKGFFLNGKHIKIKGFCDHQQHAGVGIAVPDALWDWRIKKLKEMGGNAVRMSHNAAPPAFLDACDRQGMLVMAEQRLFSSGEEGLKQLDSMVRRDRNHPSIIIWSAGNEEFDLQDSVDSEPVMKTLQKAFHRLDPTRLVTYAGSNGGRVIGANRIADVRGINYLGQFKGQTTDTSVGTLEEYHAKFPSQPIIGTEDWNTNRKVCELMDSHDYYSGCFICTGFAYYGECRWPNISAWGAVDMCGFPRFGYWFYREQWARIRPTSAEKKGTVPAAIAADLDRPSIRADGQDVDVVTIRVVDAEGNLVDKDIWIKATLNGPGKVLTLANGDDQSHDLADMIHVKTYQGRAQMLVQSTHEAGDIRIKIEAEGLTAADVAISAASCTPVPWVH